MEEQSPRLTSGASPVYHWERSALCSWLPTSATTPIRLCKPFSCKACRGTCEIPFKAMEKLNQHSINSLFVNQKLGHTTGGLRQGIRWGSGAGPGRKGCRENNTPRKQASPVPPKESMKRCVNVSREHEQAKTYSNRMREQNPRLTNG